MTQSAVKWQRSGDRILEGRLPAKHSEGVWRIFRLMKNLCLALKHLLNELDQEERLCSFRVYRLQKTRLPNPKLIYHFHL
jgi:hypothetical protein